MALQNGFSLAAKESLGFGSPEGAFRQSAIKRGTILGRRINFVR
jgi:hypothetical protein